MRNRWGGGGRPLAAKKQLPPAHFHWDLWLGPAPVQPFETGVYRSASWRRRWDLGNGTLSDMGCHHMDLPVWPLDLKYPTACQAEGPPVQRENWPLGLVVRYEFPARGDQPTLTLSLFEGSMTPRKVDGQRVTTSRAMFVGSERIMFADNGSYQDLPP